MIFIIIIFILAKNITYEKTCPLTFLTKSNSALSYFESPISKKITGKEKLRIKNRMVEYKINSYSEPIFQNNNQYLQEVELEVIGVYFKKNELVEGEVILGKYSVLNYVLELLKGGESASTC